MALHSGLAVVEAHRGPRRLAPTVELHLLGWPDDGPRVDLDHERFAYAGNFATGRTGIALAVDAVVSVQPNAATDSDAAPLSLPTDTVLGAASFDEDRAAENALRIRYVSVRRDRRGDGIGPQLLRFVVDRAQQRGFDRVRIGVNNPIAYRAAYRAGFGFTGESSGMDELVLEAPPPAERKPERYRAGLARFEERELEGAQRAVLERHLDGDPPTPCSSSVTTPPEQDGED